MKSILEFIEKNKELVNFDKKTLEIRIDDQLYIGSNLIKILQYFMKQLVVTEEKDIPVGAVKLYMTLHNLGLPKSWIKVKITSAQQRKEREQPTAAWTVYKP